MPSPESAVPGTIRQLLRLAVGSETCVTPIDAVHEILEAGRLTPLPRTPAFVRGVMNLRGAVVPVIDLAARLGAAPSTLGKRSCIVVMEAGGDEEHGTLVAGLLVDAVYEVLDVALEDIEPVPPLGTRIAPEFLSGMVRTRGQIASLLAPERVLAPAALAELITTHAP
jgi:purine-binding chemotaxis protein CheW